MKQFFSAPQDLELRHPLGVSIFWFTVVNVVIDILVSPRLAQVVPPLLRTFKPAYFLLGATGEPSQEFLRIAQMMAYWIVSTAVLPLFMRASTYYFLLVLGGAPMVYGLVISQLPFQNFPFWVTLSVFSLSLALTPLLLGIMLRRKWLPWVAGLVVVFVLFRFVQQKIEFLQYPWVSASVVELCFSVAVLKVVPPQRSA